MCGTLYYRDKASNLANQAEGPLKKVCFCRVLQKYDKISGCFLDGTIDPTRKINSRVECSYIGVLDASLEKCYLLGIKPELL